jgi:hypothetical protein
VDGEVMAVRRNYWAMYPNHENPNGMNLLTQTGLAMLFGVKQVTAAAWVVRPDFPEPAIISLDNAVLWDTVTVTEWYDKTMKNNALHQACRLRNYNKSNDNK